MQNVKLELDERHCLTSKIVVIVVLGLEVVDLKTTLWFVIF